MRRDEVLDAHTRIPDEDSTEKEDAEAAWLRDGRRVDVPQVGGPAASDGGSQRAEPRGDVDGSREGLPDREREVRSAVGIVNRIVDYILEKSVLALFALLALVVLIEVLGI